MSSSIGSGPIDCNQVWRRGQSKPPTRGYALPATV
ncbi:hypothetical protein RSAG8_03921, partial [Rhizoctonia solani AG-8 WAC10335]